MKLSRNAVWILAAAALLYVLVLPRYPIGFAIDEALYILGAQSLLSGHYANLQLPWHPALTDPLPGFPLLISSLVAAVDPHWAFLKIVPLMLTVCSGVMFWFLLEQWVVAEVRVALLALFAFNPTTVNFAGIVVSEPAFLFFTLFIFLQLDNLTEWGKPLPALGLGVLLGWASLMRPQGILLAVSVGAALIYTRRQKAFALSISTAFLIWGGVLLRNALASHHTTGYAQHWQAILPDLINHPLRLVQNVILVVRTLLLENILAWPAAFSAGVDAVLSGILVCGAAVGVVWGGIRFSREKSSDTPTRWAVVLFTLSFFLVQAFWTAVDVHYLYPIVPFVMVFLVIGCQAIASRWPRQSAALVALFFLVGGRYLYCDARSIPNVGGQAFSIPRETYAWLYVHLPPKSFVYAPAAPALRLYSKVYAMYGSPASDIETFRCDLLKKGVTHVLAQPVDMLSFGGASDRNRVWQRTQSWLASWPGAFKRVYENPAEGTQLYDVLDDADYIPAYELYRRSYQAMQDGKPDVAGDLLEQALRLDPKIPAVLNAYGTTLMMSGSRSAAETYFQRALDIRPDYPLALLNRARLYKLLAQNNRARELLERAAELVQRTGEGEALLPAIQKELAGL